MKKSKPAIKKDSKNIILGLNNEIEIKEFRFKDSEVYSFLVDKEDKEEWLKRALIIGSIGLKNMIVGYNVDYIDKKFNEFIEKATKKFEDEKEEIQTKIDKIFSLSDKESPVSKLYKKIEETFDEDNKKSPIGKLTSHLEYYFHDKKGIVKSMIDKTFDIKNTDSPMGKFVENLNHYFDKDKGVLKKVIDQTFDINNKNTPLGKMMTSVDFYFEENRGILPKLLNDTFDPDNKKSAISQLVILLEDNFDVDKGKIKKLLDPNKQDSPINILKTDLLKHLKDIEDILKKEEAKEEIIQSTTLKGGTFEEEVVAQLELITNPYTDNFNQVTHETGRIGKSGDFVISINGDKNRKVVIECKDSKNYTKQKADEVLEEAIKNRDAKFGILLFKSSEQVPRAYHPLKITDKGVITSFDNNGLFFAYRLARMVIEKELEQKTEQIPIDKIETEICWLLNQSGVIDTILKKATEVQNAGAYIHTNLSALHSQIQASLRKIEGFVKKS